MFSCIYLYYWSIQNTRNLWVLFLKTLFCKYVAKRYKTQKMCDEAVDDCLAAPKFTPDWFAISKMIKKLLATSYTHDNILLF